MIFGKVVKKTKINKKEGLFRYPKIEDLDGLRKLHNDLVKEKAYIELQKRMTKRSQLEWLLQKIRKIEKKEGVLLIFESEGEILGYALIERFGFKIVGKIKRGFKYYGRYLDNIILVKYL